MAKHKYMWRDKQRELAEEWPAGLPEPDVLARVICYKGSVEHKTSPSFAGIPARRTDASPCDPTLRTESDRQAVEETLRDAFLRGCVSTDVRNGFPRYAWGWFRGHLYKAMLINQESGWYKAWPIESIEAPEDPDGRLTREVWDV
jgi:hypothetical protein